MPYADPEARRRVKRESIRRARAKGSTGSTVALLRGGSDPPLTAADVLAIVGRELQRVEADVRMSGSDRARAIAALSGAWCRLHEHSVTSEHVAAIKAVTTR